MFSKLRKQRRLRAFGGTQVSAPHVSHSYDCKSEISVCQLPSTYSHPESYGLTFSSTRHPLLCIRTEYRTDRRPGHREARWKKAQVGAWRPNLFLSLVNTCWNEELLLNGKHRKNQLVLRPESAAQEQLLLEFKIWLLAWSLWTHMNVDVGAAASSGPMVCLDLDESLPCLESVTPASTQSWHDPSLVCTFFLSLWDLILNQRKGGR